MNCAECAKTLTNGPAASMASEVMGDEYTESLYFCDACQKYTKELRHDRFLGETDTMGSAPLSKSEGDRLVALSKKCRAPFNKRCHCAAHQAWF